MHVWIVNHYSSTESKDGTDARHSWLARFLKRHGWSATLITASVSHPSGTQRLTRRRIRNFESEADFDSLWVRVPSYETNGIRRVLGMLIFGFLVLLPWYLQPLKKPDVVIGSTVHFFAALSGLVLARRFKVPFVFEVRDVWPDTLVDLGKLNPSGLLAQVMVFVSRFLAKRSDLVVSPLPRVSNYLEDLGAFGVPSLWIPNGAEASLLPNAAPPPARNPFVFMYLGSQGNTNELDLLVDAFDLFWNDNPHQDMRLRIIGDGPLKNQLEHRVSTLACRAAISFEPRVPRRVALERSREAHCMVLPAKSLAVYKYGMSPNKLFDYFLSARPVLMSSVDPTHPVSSIGAGLEVVPNSAEAFAEAMALVVSMTENELSAMGSRGRVAAETIYSYEHLAMSLARGLDSVASGGKMH